ncbi:MAG: FAD-dependent monooxygenase [Zoogloeaceae bacterium]|nr:FAD-dependent monooxygenase [Zoogloeaceae bacterium]
MLRLSEEKLPLDHSEADLEHAIFARLQLRPGELKTWRIFRRGCDARKKRAIALVYTLDVELADGVDEAEVLARREGDLRVGVTPDFSYRPPAPVRKGETRRPVVVGAGPCGLFAALLLAEAGCRPILLERGCTVRDRARETWKLWRHGALSPEANVQFGEGGAGTFSDGKLSSHIRDPRHLGRHVLETFVRAGAPPEILFLSKPHIGTFRLVKVVENLRARLLALGAEIRFQSRVDAFLLEEKSGARQIAGVRLENGEALESRQVILAIGHSARDTFAALRAQGVCLEAKPFAIGVRVEHPQSLIDRARFGDFAGHPRLGAADYKLTHQTAAGRAVYSFCMCPGGQVVAAASEEGGVVTNGMSQYSRAERNANSALVVDVRPGRDFPDAPLDGIAFQRQWERAAYQAGGGGYRAPAQLLGDFLAGRPSRRLGNVLPSYQPGILLTDLSLCLPPEVVAALREAIPVFARKIPGYDRNDALLTGVETRTSSPLRVLRDPVCLESVNTRGLYPAGEGAGYAGGILSAAVDGVRAAEAALAALRDAPPQPD